MNVSPDKPNLLGLAPGEMEAFFVSLGEKPFRARQMLPWLHRRGVSDFGAMTDMSKALRERLAEQAVVEGPTVLSRHDSADGTVKWLLAAGGGQAIETVFIPEPGRGTLCISSQVGCALDCSFCSTAQQGFNRNLTTAEIIGQVLHANKELPPRSEREPAVSNVVLMGMGEPLANYRNVVAALSILVDDFAYGLSRRRVTLSTSGIVPQIRKLAVDCNVSLAVSLHAARDSLRSELVPINRLHPIAELLDACRDYAAAHSNRHITFEYVMLAGVNDTRRDSAELAGLLDDVPAKVNLIPFNTFPGTAYRSSSAAVIRGFRDDLRRRGIVATIRKTRGDDIDAACGQLAGRVRDRVLRRLGDKPGRPVTE